LAVEAVLPALVEALHRLVSLVEVLIGTAPGVMHAHCLDIPGDPTVDERVARTAGVLLSERIERALSLPQVEHAMLELGQIEAGPDRAEPHLLVRRRHHRSFFLSKQKRRPALRTAPMPWYHPSSHLASARYALFRDVHQ